MAASHHHLKMSNGREIPLVGLGTFTLNGDVCRQAIHAALDAGYRMIDTAKAYGNEEAIGSAWKEYLASGKLRREDLFITTKLWCTHNREEDVEPELRASLERLKLDYVDLYLIHTPVAFNHQRTEQDHSVGVEEIWKGMQAIHQKGMARSIGVSNFSIPQIERIMAIATTPIHAFQVELHLHFPQFSIQEVCKKHHIVLIAFSPLGSAGRSLYNHKGPRVWLSTEEAHSPLKNALVVQLAEKYSKTPAQVLLRHLTQRGICVVPKSANGERIKQNVDIFDWKLEERDMEQLNNVKEVARLFLEEIWIGHPEDPFKEERAPNK